MMKPLTELDLRLLLKDREDPRSYAVPPGTVVTPSAKEYLKSRRIELIYEEEHQEAKAAAPLKYQGPPAPVWNFSAPKKDGDSSDGHGGEAPKQLFIGPDGGQFDHKPEALTHLKGRQLVHKDHPVIIWRGRLDSLCALIVEAQLRGQAAGNQKFIDQLEEILAFVRRLLVSELRNKEVEEFKLLGLTAADLRERSHDPVKFFGYRHMLTTWKMGPLCVALNSCRAVAREVELAAAAAFKNQDGGVSRDDIIRALNRLSSLFYLMMFDYLPEGFVPEHSGI